MPITITEGLSETQLLKKKISEKEKYILAHITIPANIPDPLAEKGGTSELVKRERQALSDLRNRLIKIRTEISKANTKTLMTVKSETKSIFDWLTWKKEIYPGQRDLLRTIMKDVMDTRLKEKNSPQLIAISEDKKELLRYKFNVDSEEIQKSLEETEEIFGILDGQLSLKNATVMIEV